MLHRFICKLQNTIVVKRFLLTKAYPCTTLWNERLNGITCDLSANDLSIQLQAHLSANNVVSALDFDILMNKSNEMDLRNISFIFKIIMDFRKTQEAIKMFESSSHGVIRSLMEIDEPQLAVDLIKNRENTGIFLDEVSVNLLIDRFIIDQNWTNAFLTSAEWILQECIETSRLSVAMCLISCLNCWQQGLWKYKPPIVDVSKLPEEYKFVMYKRPDYFDDHFDLCGDNYRRRLLGKCLSLLCNHIQLIDDNNVMKYYQMNLRLLGLALHEKLDNLILYVEKWLSEETIKLNDSMIFAVSDLITTSETNNNKSDGFHSTHSEEQISNTLSKFQNLVKEFQSKELTDDQDLINNTLELSLNKVEELCNNETEHVAEKYKFYISNRLASFEKAKLRLRNQEILLKSKEKLLQLTEQEEMIRFFEKMPEVLYKSWLAKRTAEEKKFSNFKSFEENLNNLKKKEKPKFIVQHSG